MSVDQAAGPWFPVRFTAAVDTCSERVRDAYDADVLPDSLRFLASETFGAFGDALDAALPPSAFREGDTRDQRRKSALAMSIDGAERSMLMVRYTRGMCVKQVKRMKAKVRSAHKSDKAPRPRVGTIGDSLRASVCATDAAGMRSAWEHLSASSAPWAVVRLKNKVRVPSFLNMLSTFFTYCAHIRSPAPAVSVCGEEFGAGRRSSAGAAVPSCQPAV